MPGKPDRALGSMGIYVFDADYLYQLLEEGLANCQSEHDFGKNVIPRVVADGQALAHPLNLSSVPWSTRHNPYWRDVSTVDAFWAANRVDRGCRIPDGLVVGEDADLVARRFHRTHKGVVLVTKAMLETL